MRFVARSDSAIWNACQSELTPVHIAGGFTRVVESQEQVATTRLVNNVLDRQNVLETLLEQSKPKRVPGTEHLHYLLATPWRYPPLRYGSRFGQRTEPSLFYASFGVSTALAETAYYRWVFYGDMEVSIKGAVMSSHTSFESEYSANSGLRLQAPPFDTYRSALTDPERYVDTQALGRAMRESGIEAFEFVSARDPDGGLNVALLHPGAHATPDITHSESWQCRTDAELVVFSRNGHPRAMHEFSRKAFVRPDGQLPRPC